METKDLMIGDLVLISVWDCNPFPSKVTSINYNSYQGKDFVDWIDTEDEEEIGMYAVQPIPLTPEILEKNFGKPYPRGGFHNYRMEKDETIAFVIEDRRVSAAPDNRVVLSRCPGTYICDVNYVHELQHALRLLGIEKDITL